MTLTVTESRDNLSDVTRLKKDANNEYVSKSADPADNSKIYNLTDEENETADYRGANNGRVITGEEFFDCL